MLFMCLEPILHVLFVCFQAAIEHTDLPSSHLLRGTVIGMGMSAELYRTGAAPEKPQYWSQGSALNTGSHQNILCPRLGEKLGIPPWEWRHAVLGRCLETPGYTLQRAPHLSDGVLYL